ncbi:hypothetical protein WDU94_012839 [Cyamophila willieti]
MSLYGPFFGFFDAPANLGKVVKITFKCCACVEHSPDIKDFVQNDLPLWSNLNHEKDWALNPTIVFEDKDGKIIFDLDVTEMSRHELNDVLKRAGLRKLCYMFDGKPTIVPRDNEPDLF